MGRFGKGLPVLVHRLMLSEDDDEVAMIAVLGEEVKVVRRGVTNATAADRVDDAK